MLVSVLYSKPTIFKACACHNAHLDNRGLARGTQRRQHADLDAQRSEVSETAQRIDSDLRLMQEISDQTGASISAPAEKRSANYRLPSK